MSTALLISGAESRMPVASGRLNALLIESARAELQPHFEVLTTHVQQGYDVTTEQSKFLEADLVVFQFPVFWFALPPSLKKYIDDVYSYGVFFGPTPHYGRGGLLAGKDYLMSTTWNAAADDFHSSETVIGDRSADDVLIAFHLTQQYVGLRKLASFAEYDVVQGPDVETAGERLRQHLRRHVVDERHPTLA